MWQRDKFLFWFYLAKAYETTYDACILSTVRDGIPSARVVLLKDVPEDGLIFYTNYESEKAIDIGSNNNVSLLFYWPILDRQIRIVGNAEKLSAKESDRYFDGRPYLSRVGAWASNQSRPMNRFTLFIRVLFFLFRFVRHVPRPDHWGGYLIRPTSIEFWVGKMYRLHTRVRHEKENDWRAETLAP